MVHARVITAAFLTANIGCTDLLPGNSVSARVVLLNSDSNVLYDHLADQIIETNDAWIKIPARTFAEPYRVSLRRGGSAACPSGGVVLTSSQFDILSESGAVLPISAVANSFEVAAKIPKISDFLSGSTGSDHQIALSLLSRTTSTAQLLIGDKLDCSGDLNSGDAACSTSVKDTAMDFAACAVANESVASLVKKPDLQPISEAQQFISSVTSVDLTLQNSGAEATECRIAPDLPPGLQLSVQGGSCRISGTPEAASGRKTYSISAISVYGEESEASVTIEVVLESSQVTGAPSATPSAPTFENITKSSVRINWDDVDNETGYVVERGFYSGGNCSSITPISVTLAVNSANTLSVNDTASPSLVAGTPYCYRVKATGQTNDSAFSNWAVVITEPDAPSILSQTTSSITINWSNVAGVSYRLYRSTSTQSVSTSDSLVSGSASPTVADNSASCGSPNYYALLPEISGASSVISEGSAAGYCRASSPSISPAEGSYSSAQNATISTSTPGASTCYTTDGSAPTPTGACESSGTTLCNVGDSTTPSIDSTTEIKAISCKSNYVNSDAVSHNITIVRGNPAVYTINATTAYMVGTSGTIKSTTDSGGNWTTVTSPTSNDLTGIYCSSTTSCVISGFGGEIYTTTNFTSSPPTWTSRAVSGVTANLTAMHFSTSSYGVIVGYGGTVLTTTNGGTTWTNRTSSGVATEDLFGAYASSTSIFYAVGASGAVLKSTNFSSFTKSTVSGNPTLRGVSAMNNGSHVYIVGDSATVLYSSNSGASYSAQSAPSGFTHHLYAVDCQGPELCFAAGSGGNMMTTTDSGTTWSAISSGTVSSIYSLSIRPTKGAHYAAGTSSADDFTIAPAVSFLGATPISSTSISVGWTDVSFSQGNSYAESGYHLQRSTNGSDWFDVNSSIAANNTSATVSGLSTNTTYYFRIRTKSASSTSSWYPVPSTAVSTLTPPVGTVNYSRQINDGSHFLTTSGNLNPSLHSGVSSTFSGSGSLSARIDVTISGSTTSCNPTTDGYYLYLSLYDSGDNELERIHLSDSSWSQAINYSNGYYWQLCGRDNSSGTGSCASLLSSHWLYYCGLRIAW